jgi:hypothetical protein
MSENGGTRAAARGSVTAVVGVLSAVGLLLVMLTWAATIGPDEVISGGKEPSYQQPTPTVTGDSSAAGDPSDGDRERHELLWMILTITVFLLAGVLVLAVLLNGIRWALTRDWRRRRERDPDEIAFQTLGAPALARVVAAGAQAQRQALSEGSPRNAIVECWHRFEQHAAQVGIARNSWETSSEFTLRVLEEVSADSAAVTELAGLYRDARHSHHVITEESRARARDALDRILGSLGAPAEAP